MSDNIPAIATYRDIPIHNCQSRERVEVVKAEIDAVHAMADVDDLGAFAMNWGNAPESRMLAAAKFRAIFAMAAAERRSLPSADAEKVRTSVYGLASQRWRSRTHYYSTAQGGLPPIGSDRPVIREVPLTDEQLGRS